MPVFEMEQQLAKEDEKVVDRIASRREAEGFAALCPEPGQEVAEHLVTHCPLALGGGLDVGPPSWRGQTQGLPAGDLLTV
jgi:hypothetical protein